MITIEDYTKSVLDELTPLSASQRYNINDRTAENGLKISIGEIEIQGVGPYNGGIYPQTIDFAYKKTMPKWKKIKETIKMDDKILKKYKIKEDNSIISSILMEDDNSFVKLVFDQERKPSVMYGWIVSDFKESMIKGLETIIDLSKFVGVRTVPFTKSSFYGLDNFNYRGFNAQRFVADVLA